ncbi:hypothetical protein DFA_10850 [Cavenderia fasciculata]|uniref:TraB family protein n=1 Tax=Cavenderia fasciculata TaxID=261658 RepID=F4QBK4_CACFS|nr:uncharacterized protein DFA_10850 [Cavenderia fasciculata]EGG14976.1 hypothetical protein DFA_10850 [Cavenderia fasciculata]|eukprot:XP_004351492.1 hypothetical protein DFA_10850 [Cavenderia fasciculata]
MIEQNIKLIRDKWSRSKDFNVENLIRVIQDKDESGSDTTIYLVGTSHLFNESSELVEHVIDVVKPSHILIELSHERKPLLQLPESTIRSGFTPNKDPISRIPWFTGNLEDITIMLQMTYTYYCFRLLDRPVIPGWEMRAAWSKAKANNIPVLLGDRDSGATVDRMLHSLSFSTLLSLSLKSVVGMWRLSQMSPQEIRENLNSQIEQSLHYGSENEKVMYGQELLESLPQVSKILIEERDRYLASNLRELRDLRDTSLKFTQSDGTKKKQVIVSVTGLAHLNGIERFYKEDNQYDGILLRKALEEVDPPGPVEKYGYHAILGTSLLLPPTIATASTCLYNRYRSPQKSFGGKTALTLGICLFGLELFAANRIMDNIRNKIESALRGQDIKSDLKHSENTIIRFHKIFLSTNIAFYVSILGYGGKKVNQMHDPKQALVDFCYEVVAPCAMEEYSNSIDIASVMCSLLGEVESVDIPLHSVVGPVENQLAKQWSSWLNVYTFKQMVYDWRCVCIPIEYSVACVAYCIGVSWGTFHYSGKETKEGVSCCRAFDACHDGKYLLDVGTKESLDLSLTDGLLVDLW